VGDDIGPGRLLLIVVDAGDAGLPAPRRLEEALGELVRAADLRRLDVGAGPALVYLAYADAAPGAVRDALAAALGPGARAFVVEFEGWSALGDVADAAWLLRRGH